MPPGWRHWEPARKIEWLLQIPLDRCMEIVSWDPATLEPRLLAAQIEIIRVVLTIGSRAGLLLAESARRFTRKPDGTAPDTLGASGTGKTGVRRGGAPKIGLSRQSGPYLLLTTKNF